MMKWLYILALPWLSFAAVPNEPEAELLALQRIADFWEDGETSIAKAQMIDFLAHFPNSLKKDMLAEALGDLSLKDSDFSSALEWYSKIQMPSSDAFLKKLRCLYQLGWYSTLIDEASNIKEKSLEISRILALSLYQQALNDGTKQTELAQRAKPLFEELLQNDQNEEIVHALAHIYTMLDDLEGASNLYENLAKLNPEKGFLLQAALIETKFAPEKALELFQTILTEKKEGISDAAYWWLVVSAKLGLHENISKKWEELLPLVDDSLKGSVYVLAGSSYRQIGQNDKAIELFHKALENTDSSEKRRICMLCLAESSYLAEDLPELEKTIQQIQEESPSDPTLAFWQISKAKILEKMGKLEDALNAISNVESDLAIGEKIRLEILLKRPNHAREIALIFLDKIQDAALKPQGFRLLLQASEAFAKEDPKEKITFLQDLKRAILEAGPSLEEEKSWRLIAAALAIELGNLQDALNLAKPLAENHDPDAELLCALSLKNTAEFIPLAETALKNGATIIPTAAQHLMLFNAYRETDLKAAAEHLYLALSENIQEENLLWLSQFAETNFSAEKREKIAEKICLSKDFVPHLEKPFLEWARAKEELNKTDEAASLYEQILAGYRLKDEFQYIAEAKWRYAKLLQKMNEIERASLLYEEVCSSTCSKRDYFIAAATLDFARSKKDPVEAATSLRDLILQKYLPNEPLHLEAALDTIDLLGTDAEKKLALLKKMKHEFTEEETLLSKEYHAARKVNPEKNQIFETYLKFIEGSILLLDNDPTLQQKGETLLTELKEDIRLSKRVDALINRPEAHATTD